MLIDIYQNRKIYENFKFLNILFILKKCCTAVLLIFFLGLRNCLLICILSYFSGHIFYIKSADNTKNSRFLTKTGSEYIHEGVRKYSNFTNQRTKKMSTMFLWILISLSTLFQGKIFIYFLIKIFSF